jgi:hypothetical protein
MFQWFYDLCVSYIMQFIALIYDFLGLNSNKKVHFGGDVKEQEQSDDSLRRVAPARAGVGAENYEEALRSMVPS